MALALGLWDLWFVALVVRLWLNFCGVPSWGTVAPGFVCVAPVVPVWLQWFMLPKLCGCSFCSPQSSSCLGCNTCGFHGSRFVAVSSVVSVAVAVGLWLLWLLWTLPFQILCLHLLRVPLSGSGLYSQESNISRF